MIHAEKGWDVVGVMCARLLIISGIILVLAMVLPGDSIAFYAFMAVAYIITIPYALWLKNRLQEVGRNILPIQFVVDLVWVTGLVYFTGGLDSDLTMLYPLVILTAGIVAPPLRAFQVAILSSLAYVLLAVLLAQGLLVSYIPDQKIGTWTEVLQIMGMRVFVFMCFGGVSAYVSQKCHFVDLRIEGFRHVAEIIFRNVRAGLMLLDERGHILMANERACDLLGQQEEKLVTRTVHDLVAEGCKLQIIRKEGSGPCHFVRPDGTSFPVSYEVSRVTLPGDALPGARGKESTEVLLMAFSDITQLMAMQERVKYLEQVRAATEMAATIAHEVRSPLTTISGSLQIISRLEQKAVEGDEQSSDLLRRERQQLYSNVVRETSRLDKIIERLISFASCTPEAVAELMQARQDIHSASQIMSTDGQPTIPRR